MKLIDLLVKIANGEEVKFKIIDEQEEYYCKKNDFLRDINNQEVDWWLDCLWLNKEVEIIEEDKKIPEKLEILNANEHSKKVYYENYSKEEISLDIETLQIWVNEIIDYLKSKGE